MSRTLDSSALTAVQSKTPGIPVFLMEAFFDSVVDDSTIEWTTLPAVPAPDAPRIIVEASIDDGGTWHECTNGGEVPVLEAGGTYFGHELRIRASWVVPEGVSGAVNFPLLWPQLGPMTITINYDSGSTQLLRLLGSPYVSPGQVGYDATTHGSYNGTLANGDGKVEATSRSVAQLDEEQYLTADREFVLQPLAQPDGAPWTFELIRYRILATDSEDRPLLSFGEKNFEVRRKDNKVFVWLQFFQFGQSVRGGFLPVRKSLSTPADSLVVDEFADIAVVYASELATSASFVADPFSPVAIESSTERDSQVLIYVNQRELARASYQTLGLAVAGQLNIGRSPEQSQFAGFANDDEVAEVRIWDKPLSPAEMQGRRSRPIRGYGVRGNGDPGDIEFTASTKTIAKASGGLGKFKVGDLLTVVDAQNATNNGTKTVATVPSDLAITVSESLADEECSSASLRSGDIARLASRASRFELAGDGSAGDIQFDAATKTITRARGGLGALKPGDLIYVNDPGLNKGPYLVDGEPTETAVTVKLASSTVAAIVDEDSLACKLVIERPVSGDARGLRLCWRLDEGMGNLLHDSSGSGFNGTFTGAATGWKVRRGVAGAIEQKKTIPRWHAPPIDLSVEGSRVIRLCTQPRGAHLEWGGHTFLAVGDLGSISALTEKSDLSTASARLALSGILATHIGTALGEHYLDRPLNIYLGFFNQATGVLTVPALIFQGRMDRMPVKIDHDAAEVGLEVENSLVDWQRTSERLWNDVDQKARFADDLGFALLADTTKKNIVWPQSSFLSNGDPQASD